MVRSLRTLLAFLLITPLLGCSRGPLEKEKLAQIRVWEDQGWTANGRMTAFLSDRSEVVRERAALALGRVDDTLALDSLRRALLADPSPQVRSMAAFALSIWTFKLGRGAIAEAASTEKDPDALLVILQAFARIYAREEYEQILPHLRHPDPRVRAQTALTLDVLNRREAADSIVPLFGDPDADVRRAALFAVSRMNSENAALAALPFVNSDDPETRAAAIKAVSSARIPERAQTVATAFTDPDIFVRCAAADACLAMRDTAAINRAIPLLRSDSSVAFVQRILRALAEHMHAQAAGAVRELMTHPDPTIRAGAVVAVCHRRDSPCWDDLIRAADDPDWRVRVAMFDAFDKTARFQEIVADVAPAIRRLLSDPFPKVRAKALQNYVTYGGPDWEQELNRLYHDSSDHVVAMAVGLIGSMHMNLYVDSLYQLYPKYALDPNPDVKWAITAASANMMPGVQLDSLRQDLVNWGLADPNRLVRWYAIAVALKFRQDRRNELGVYLTDLSIQNIDSLLPEYASAPVARIETTRGVITVELDTHWAPRTVRRFMENARNRVYDNTPLGELQGGQMVVLGDRSGDETNLPAADVRDEFSPTQVEAGTLLWSITTRDSGRGLFMISLTRLPYQDWRFPSFGRVTGGLEVARSLTLADTIRTVQIITAGVS